MTQNINSAQCLLDACDPTILDRNGRALSTILGIFFTHFKEMNYSQNGRVQWNIWWSYTWWHMHADPTADAQFIVGPRVNFACALCDTINPIKIWSCHMIRVSDSAFDPVLLSVRGLFPSLWWSSVLFLMVTLCSKKWILFLPVQIGLRFNNRESFLRIGQMNPFLPKLKHL